MSGNIGYGGGAPVPPGGPPRRYRIPDGTRESRCKHCYSAAYWITTGAGKHVFVDANGEAHFLGCPARSAIMVHGRAGLDALRARLRERVAELEQEASMWEEEAADAREEAKRLRNTEDIATARAELAAAERGALRQLPSDEAAA